MGAFLESQNVDTAPNQSSDAPQTVRVDGYLVTEAVAQRAEVVYQEAFESAQRRHADSLKDFHLGPNPTLGELILFAVVYGWEIQWYADGEAKDEKSDFLAANQYSA
ncbi:MAG: hypothetical protein AB8B88_01110 [Devosiaceae bacterium]